MILIIGRRDRHVEFVGQALDERKSRWTLLDMSALWDARISVRVDGPNVHGSLAGAGVPSRTALEEVTAVWLQSVFPADHPSMSAEAAAFANDEWRALLENLACAMPRAYWVNPMGSWRVTESRLAVLQAAANCGLSTPNSLVTNDVDELSEFQEEYGDDVAIKRLHQSPQRPRSFATYTNRLTRIRLSEKSRSLVRYAPVFVQTYVPKDVEVRTYVVGERVLTAEILSQEIPDTVDDWRRYPVTPDGRVDMARWRCRPAKLPASVEERCLALARNLGLRYAALDFIRAPSGEYLFLEANATAAFGWLEEAAGIEVSSALADVLIERTGRSSAV